MTITYVRFWIIPIKCKYSFSIHLSPADLLKKNKMNMLNLAKPCTLVSLLGVFVFQDSSQKKKNVPWFVRLDFTPV